MGYTNSPLVDYVKISPNKTVGRKHKLDTITIHCVVGQCTAEGLGDWFYKESTQASSNYGVDKNGRIGMYVEEKDRSWCTSSSANDNRAVTIEVASDTKHPYAVNDKAFAAMLDLVTDICYRNGIEKLVWSESKDERKNHLNGCNMTVHRDYANKSCPGEYLYSRHGEIAETVNKRLNAMKMTEDENYYRCNKGVSVQLSKNFKSTEFDCKCKDSCNQTTISKQLLKYLQQIRDHFNKSVNINSGYRCEAHNKDVGGVTNSYHRNGEAADISVKDVKPLDVARYAESIGIKGIGLYETDKDGYFVHVDIRTTKSFWYGQAQSKRDTFQEVKIEEPKQETTTTLTVNDFTVGDIVEFTGTTHYINSSAKTGYKTVPGTAKITSIYKNGTHQLHLRAVNKNGNFVSGVYGWVNISDVKKIEKTVSDLKVGDIVQFAGNTHYISANATNGKTTKPGKAMVTSVFKNGKHPIHLRAINENGKFTSGVYGWVNLEDIEI